MVRDKFMDMYDNYFDDVYRYVYFKVGNKWDADDLVSIIFRKSFESFGTIKGNSKAWLFKITNNTIIDYYRKVKEIAIGDDLDLYAYPSNFEECIEKQDNINYLVDTLKNLSKEELELINLRYYSNLKYKEIAEITGKTDDSIKMKIGRIIQKLSEFFKE